MVKHYQCAGTCNLHDEPPKKPSFPRSPLLPGPPKELVSNYTLSHTRVEICAILGSQNAEFKPFLCSDGAHPLFHPPPTAALSTMASTLPPVSII